MIKAILFDCFGVLVGTGFEHTYRMAGGDPIKDQAFIEDTLRQENLGLITPADFQEALIRKLSISDDDWQRAIGQAEQPDLELLRYIEQLRKNYKTAVMSNASLGVVESRIGGDWLKKCFDEIIVSAEIGLIKPDLAIYKYTAEKLGVKLGECVFVDDREVHLAPARSLGMQTILYEGFPQTKYVLEQLLADSKS
jgi:putative hydrolase of the HAD superfamily